MTFFGKENVMKDKFVNQSTSSPSSVTVLTSDYSGFWVFIDMDNIDDGSGLSCISEFKSRSNYNSRRHVSFTLVGCYTVQTVFEQA